MKKNVLTMVASVLICFLGYTIFVPTGIAAETTADIVVPRQYIALARMLADSKSDMEKAAEITAKAVSSVVAKGKTYEEKLSLLSEISSALMAAVVDWTEAEKTVVVDLIVTEALKLASDKAEGNYERIGFVKQVFASIRFATNDSISLINAQDRVPEDLQEFAAYAIENAMAVLGGTEAWKCKDLYDDVRAALENEESQPKLSDAMIVTVSTTTTTTSTTTTTTTTIPGMAIPGRPSRPSTIPTTKPSPTPVGLR